MDMVIREVAHSGESTTLILGAAIGLLSALITTTAAVIWKWLIKPQLSIEFGPGLEHHSETETEIPMTSGPPVAGEPQIYLRPKVTNIGPRFIRWVRPIAVNCKVNLVAIEEYSIAANDFIPTIYVDNIPLTWSCQQGDERWKLDIYPDIPQFFDLVAFIKDTKHGPRPFYPVLKVPPLRYVKHLFNRTGLFRLTVLITADNVASTTERFLFQWEGHSDTYKARIEP